VQRLYIFGADATNDGVHDVHMNQGDPDGSSFQHLDGIWQDGGVGFEYGPPQPRLDVLQIKFETQSLHTDDQGHPILWPPLRPIYAYIPRWWWQPGDPWTDHERATLVEQGLLELAFSAATIPTLGKAAATALTRDLERKLAERLSGSNDERIARSIQYLIGLGRAVRAHLITAAHTGLQT
jgi:Uncharacterized conserved protein (DUF2278)